MPAFRFTFLIVVIMFFSTGCGATVPVTGASAPPVSGQTAIPVDPTPAAPLPTATRTDVSSGGPTSTLMPAGWPGVMSVYPLAQGAAWTYQVAIDYASTDGSSQRWEGEISETVVEAMPHIENWVFHTALKGDLSHTWTMTDRYYVAKGGGLYRFFDEKSAADATNPQSPEPSANQVLAWPLEDGQRWGAPEFIANGSSKNVWYVTASERVDVPAGHYEDCFRIEMLTNPDDSHYWFCAGVGFVRYEYRHHGTLQNEVWELSGFAPGP